MPETGVGAFSLDKEEVFLIPSEVDSACIKLSPIIVGSVVPVLELELRDDSFVLGTSFVSLSTGFLGLSGILVVEVIPASDAKLLEVSIVVVVSIISLSLFPWRK